MNKVSREHLQQLVNFENEWAVSIFMSTHRAGPETRQDPIRFKNLLRLAEHAMAHRGVVNGTRARSLEPATRLVPDNDFWQHQSDGLAVFLGPDHFSYFTVPIHFAENVVVDGRFHVKPLLPAHYGDGRFYLLSLSQKRVRVFVGSRDELEEIQVVGVPTGIEEYMRFIDPATSNQNRPAVPRGGGTPVAYNSHGVGGEDEKQRIGEFFHQVDAGLHDLLKDETAPLVVACVDYLFPLYVAANTYAHLQPDHVRGNPESCRSAELHHHAWKLVEPRFAERQAAAVALYRELEGSRKASRKIKSVVPAAFNGRVDTLLVAADQEIWGVFDPETGHVKETKQAPPADAQELLNLSAIHTLHTGGTVYALPSEEMPHGVPMAAIYRY